MNIYSYKKKNCFLTFHPQSTGWFALVEYTLSCDTPESLGQTTWTAIRHTTFSTVFFVPNSRSWCNSRPLGSTEFGFLLFPLQ